MKKTQVNLNDMLSGHQGVETWTRELSARNGVSEYLNFLPAAALAISEQLIFLAGGGLVCR